MSEAQPYRTLIRGQLVQQSGFTVGGSTPTPGGADLQCARDGKDRLTIPGPGLAGALVETAGRIFPELLQDDESDTVSEWDRISGKRRLNQRPARDREDESARQSLWQFWPAHPEKNLTEFRQGVGIRQKTGATASEAKALFDMETIPAGMRWDLFLELDVRRGGAHIEGVALLALCEWVWGRCWLGASAARGLGWMTLDNLEVLRLSASPDAVDAWPDSSRSRTEIWEELAQKHEVLTEEKQIYDKGLSLCKEANLPLPEKRFSYLRLQATLSAGAEENGYGWNSLSVGGHAAGFLHPFSQDLTTPHGVDEVDYRTEVYVPDAPIVTTQVEKPVPFVPGSGIRGPLRHATSRWHNAERAEDDPVIDPNSHLGRFQESKLDDEVSPLFGLVEESGRLLVRDARLTDEKNVDLAWLQHHAEDEFVGSVFGSGKFDRTALMGGTFDVELVLEAEDSAELKRLLATLLPALRLAELGYVALGGGKWRGHGWLPWKFIKIEQGLAGERWTEIASEKQDVQTALSSILTEEDA